MTYAPEQIWDFWPHDGGNPVVWREPCPFPADDADVFEYIRADLARPMTVAEAARRLIDEINRPATHEEKPDWRYLSRLDMTSLRALSEGGE